MDQSSSNGPDKRNWRERLGIGTKELPRISEEFKPRKEPAMAAGRPGDAPGVAVAKPAPMAPRVAPKPAPVVKPAPLSAPKQESAPAQGQDNMAERLKAQRVAAEKLAEQRVNAARERAEAVRSTESKPAAPKPASPMTAPMPSLAVSKPKFSFADEEASSPAQRDFSTSFTQRPAQPPVPTQLVPPRPALGGDRSVPPAVRSPSQPAPSFQPQYRPPQPPPGFRPIDPSSGMPAPPRINPRAYGETSYPPAAPERPVPARPAYEPSYRQNSETGAPPDSGRADYRPGRQRPQPKPQAAYEEDYGDVFEDDAPRASQSRRASARDYNQAYRDVEDGYGEEGRRSAGPLIILGMVLLTAIAAGAGVYYYQMKVKTEATATESGEVPVVAAPEAPAKTAAETPAEPPAAVDGTEIPAADTKKQIYDRIVGDREVLGGQMVPTEEAPVPPPLQPDQGTNATQPDASAPQPAADGDTVPLPLPPPPGDGDGSQTNTQGTLTEPVPDPANNATVEAASALPDAPAQPEATQAASDTAETKPPETLELKDDQPKQVEAAPPPAKPKKVAAKPQKVKQKAKPKPVPEQDSVANAGEPLVLVPPAGGETAAAAPQAGEAVAPAPKKKKTLLDLFKRDQTNAGAEIQQPAQQQVATVDPDQQVGSLPAAKPAKPQAAAPAPGGGYVAQLASFRTQAEATREWNRIKSKHGGIVSGLSPRISQATVAGSTRYRLGVGPMADKGSASQLCDSLLAAGERDCIVRAQ